MEKVKKIPKQFISMGKAEKVKTSKYVLNDKQIRKIQNLSKQLNLESIDLLEKINSNLVEVSLNPHFSSWESLVNCFEKENLKEKITRRDVEIQELKEKIVIQKQLLKDYEYDYLAIIELGRALELLNKV